MRGFGLCSTNIRNNTLLRLNSLYGSFKHELHLGASAKIHSQVISHILKTLTRFV